MSSSGDITYGAYIENTNISSTFYITVYKLPLLLPPSITAYSLAIGSNWSYTLRAFSYYNDSITCTCNISYSFKTPPKYNDTTKILLWTSVSNTLTNSTKVSNFFATFTCYDNIGKASSTKSQIIDIPFLTKCSIGSISNLNAKYNTEWIQSITVTFYNSYSRIKFESTTALFGLSIVLDSFNSTSYNYTLKWTPISITITLQSITLKCTEYFDSMNPLTNSVTDKITIEVSNPAFLNNCSNYQVVLDQNYTCNLSTSNAASCYLSSTVGGITAKFSNTICIISWSAADNNAYGINKADITVVINDSYSATTDLTISLYPNELPILNSLNSIYEVDFGEIYFSLQLNSTNTQILEYTINTAPSGLSISNSGLLTWTSPLNGTTPSTDSVNITITNTLPSPVSAIALFSLVHNYNLTYASPACPNEPSIIINSSWQYSVTVSPNASLAVYNFPGSVTINVLSWTPTNNTPYLGINLTFIYSNTSRSCTFNAYPNSIPIITSHSAFNQSVTTDFYYRVVYADNENTIDNLTISMTSNSSNIILVPSSFGLIYWSAATMTVGNYYFTITVTDQGIPPASASETFYIDIVSYDYPPTFILPSMSVSAPVKQYIVTGYTQSVPITIEIQVNDIDTSYNELTVFIGSFNPYGLAIVQSSTDLSIYYMKWTPAALQLSSGVIGITVQEIYNNEKFDYFELIIYNIISIVFPPIILETPNISILDNNETVFNIYFKDENTKLSGITATLSSNSGLTLKGRDALSRPVQYFSSNYSDTYNLTLCSGTSCAYQISTIQVNMSNHPPEITLNGDTVFLFTEAGDYSPIWTLPNQDQYGNNVIYCPEISEGYGEINISSDTIWWSSVSADSTYAIILINSTYSTCPVINNYSTNILEFCVQYLCSLAFSDNISVYIYGNVLKLNITSDLIVYTGSRVCDFLNMTGFSYYCAIPNEIMVNYPAIFIGNSYGLSIPYFARVNNVKKNSSSMSISPQYGIGISGEIITITLNPIVSLDFRCILQGAYHLKVYNGILYNDNYDEFFCVLPEMIIDTYNLQLVEEYSQITYYATYLVYGIPTMSATTTLEGHDYGGYIKNLQINLIKWPLSSVYLRFGDFQIINTTLVTSTEISFIVPARIDFTNSTTPIYISPTINPYSWSSYILYFTYTGNCETEGTYCNNDLISDCTTGHYCNTQYSSLNTPSPCIAGYYQNQTHQSNCAPCQVGYMCNEDALDNMILCEAGFICDRSQISYPMIMCPPGYYCNEGTNTQLVNSTSLIYYQARIANLSTNVDLWLTRGTYSLSSNSYNHIPFMPSCISKYFTGSENVSTLISPILCPNNKYCLLATKTNITDSNFPGSWYSPQDCTIGYTCNQGDGDSFDNSQACVTGSFCPGTNIPTIVCSGTSNLCQTCLCPEGYSCPYESMTSPSICSPGSYQPSCGEAACLSCPESYYCDGTGLMNYTGICQSGYMCPEGTSTQKPCNTGTYNNLTGQINCIDCPIGTYCPSQGMTTPKVCNSGYICNTVKMSLQIPCPEGYYCPSGTNSSNTSSCSLYDHCPQPCQAGYQCPIASATQEACNLGYYQNEKAQGACKPCEVGYFCPGIGLISMQPCPSGSFCSSSTLSDTSGPCPGGYYCLEGTASNTFSHRRLTSTSCNTTDIMNYFGGVLPKEPIPCQPGTYCPQGTASGVIDSPSGPQKCPIGTYSDTCETVSCTECDSGYSCAIAGTINPVLCPEGTYRSGQLVIECQNCPLGTWSGGKAGLGTVDDCSPCPEAYACPQEGTANYSMMSICSAGYYCPAGSSDLVDLCKSGFMCPSGLSDKNATEFPCIEGFVCTIGTDISYEMLNLCISSSSNCLVGNKCARGYYCESGTSDQGLKCPDGTNSEEGSFNIYNCTPNNNVPTDYGFVYIVNTANVSLQLSVLPLSYTIYTFSNLNYPLGNVPDAYTIILNVEGANQYKIPFIQAGSYSPIYRLPLSNSFSTFMSNQGCNLEFGILAHKSVTLTFTIQFLSGIYTDTNLNSKFSSSVNYISTQYSTRFNQNSFLAVLNRNSQGNFKQPANLPVHQILPSDISKYSTDMQSFVDSVSISVLSGISTPIEAIYPQTSYDFWSALQYAQKLYPLDYLPYITDCDGYGSHIPLYLLFANDKCNLVNPDKTISVSILQPFTTPNGDSCNLQFTCKTSEKTSTTDAVLLWFDSFELSSSNIFYFTRTQVDMYAYSSYIPEIGISENAFSSNFYGSSSIIGVSSVRSAPSYTVGMIPKMVKLYVGYYQKNRVDKEILTSTIYFEEFTSNLTDSNYTFNFVLEALNWKDCLDLFAFEAYLYYLFVMMVCLFILIVVVLFWAVNYMFSTILPRPNLKLKLYLNYSLRAIKGIYIVVFPAFGLIFSCLYILKYLEILQRISGDFYDDEPINPSSVNDSTRVTQYMNGRLGTCISVIGMFMVIRSSDLLFPDTIIAANPKEIPKLNKDVKKIRGLFMWSLVPVLIFSISIYQFAKSQVYYSLQTLFIFLFKITNTRIVEMNRQIFDDELYVLPFYGAMSLSVMIVTIKVGAFTTFLTGYLTNIFIKIAKRAFLEPYRLEIKNKILKYKQKFKLGGSSEIATSLSFKDRIYIEQVSDLGANSLESIVAWLFPTLIVFNYVLYSELQLAIAKDFLEYFIVFCFLQAFSDIGYDIFLNNALECRTGRLLSEKITDLRKIYDSRKCLWTLCDRTAHSGKELVTSLDNLLKLGFSTQYFFLMTLITLGIVFQTYAVELWVNWTYNPLQDPAAIFIMIAVYILCWCIEKIIMIIGKYFKVWQLKDLKEEEKVSFDQLIKIHLTKVIDENNSLGKEDLFYAALAEAVLECYDKEHNDKKRKVEVIKLLKDINQEIDKEMKKDDDGNIENIDIDNLPLPKIRPKTSNRIMKIRNKISPVPLKVYGKWPNALIYPWKSYTEMT